MIPTKTQKNVCDAIIRQLQYWRDTNDLDSPTHYSDMNDCFNAELGDILSEEEIEGILQNLTKLFQTIKYLSV